MNSSVEYSVIVPIYNAERYLKKSIESILDQTFRNFELLLINDGSTDNSLEICSNYEKLDKRVKVFNNKNEGSIKARKFGIERSKGEYITFVDSDDWISKDLLMKVNKSFLEYDFDIVCFNSFKVFGNCGLIKRENDNMYFKGSKSYFNEEINLELIAAWFHGHPFPANVWGKVYKSQQIKGCGIYQEGTMFLYDDLLLNFEVFLNSKSVKTIDESLYYYRFGGGTSKYMPYFFNDVINTYMVQKKIINEYYKGHIEEYFNGISIMLLNTLKTILYNNMESSQSEEKIKSIIYSYIIDVNIKEAINNEGSKKYFESEFLGAIRNNDIDYLFNLGRINFKEKRFKRNIMKVVNELI